MRLNIGGITPFTTIDFPGHLAAVVFLQGCAWRCDYCHNPHLLSVDETSDDWEKLRDFLKKRQGFLDGVVFSGGEPLLQSGLTDAITVVKDMGFKVALHTAGGNPQRLEKTLPMLDWVGLDVKIAFADYAQITGVDGSGDKVLQSLKLVLNSDVDYEIRTTVDAHFFTQDTVLELAKTLADLGVENYALQECRPVEDQPVDSGSLAICRVIEDKVNAMFDNFTLRYS
jgi:pyruvate formate lyase activating enzyme